MTRRFTQGIQHVLGVYRDIPAPDVNTNAQVMAWMMDAYSATPRLQPGHRHRQAARPRRRARAARRPPAGAACTCSTRTARTTAATCTAQRVAIQGFGNVGLVDGPRAARARAPRSSPCPTCAAPSSTPTGIDVPGLVALVGDGRVRSIEAGARRRDHQRGAARRSTATSSCPPRSARSSPRPTPTRVRAGVVVEAANYPVTPDGRQDPAQTAASR